MLHENFPRDRYAIIAPELRWYPGQETIGEFGYEKLLPPLVHTIRKEVHAWRAAGYQGCTATSRSLLNYWFAEDHFRDDSSGNLFPFRYYFCQREAVETCIWLYEVAQARDPYSLMKFDSSGAISQQMFIEDWTRYVFKLATGSGKTKVMSLLIAWSYFNNKYEADSDLARNFLLIAPNIIVLDRLRTDFDGLQIFHQDPVLPHNGYDGQNWCDDFQINLHIQDEIGHISESGNIFLSNIHRLYQGGSEPSIDDDDVTDYFLGKKPVGKTTDSGMQLDTIIREVDNLVILNDEAHHIHDPKMAWFRNIQDIVYQMRQRNCRMSVQLDLSATPKHDKGEIFVQTVCDYPLVEAIRQGVVKTPVLPDEASRAKLQEHPSDVYVEVYQDHLHLGFLEWHKARDEMVKAGKKAVWFIMTDDTKNCDSVAEYLESHYLELQGRVLVIHTNKSGEVSESASSKRNEKELEDLRNASRDIDDNPGKHDVVVSVMMLREGWDVRNVTTIVGLRPYKSKSQILPEQTLGRGLRLMFPGDEVSEKVSVIGTQAFLEFVEQIRHEGVELEYQPMGEGTTTKTPIVIEVDRDNPHKDIDKLDIELPVMSPRIYREYKNLSELQPDRFSSRKLPLRQFTIEEQRQIVFKNMDTGGVSHSTWLDTLIQPTSQAVVGFFCNTIMKELHLVGGFGDLFGAMKDYFRNHLFEQVVDLDDLNVLRNFSEPVVTKTIFDDVRRAINELTVRDKGVTRIQDTIRYSSIRPVPVKSQGFMVPKKSIFNKVIGDSGFELEFAAWLDGTEIEKFVKNQFGSGLKIEYIHPDGSIKNYLPDFIVHDDKGVVWLIETKGLQSEEVTAKHARLEQWCRDATSASAESKKGVTYKALYVLQTVFEKHKPKTFAQLVEMLGG